MRHYPVPVNDQPPPRWRIPLLVRMFAWVAFLVVNGIIALATFGDGDPDAWGPGLVAFLVVGLPVPVLLVLTATLPVAWIEGDDLVYRNVRRRRRVPLAAIASLQPRDWILRLERSDGERPVWLWSLPKVPFSDFRSKPSSTDLACVAVADAARERGATVELIDVRLR